MILYNVTMLTFRIRLPFLAALSASGFVQFKPNELDEHLHFTLALIL